MGEIREVKFGPPDPNEDVVAVLRGLLARAEAGEISRLIYVAHSAATTNVETGWTDGDALSGLGLIGVLRRNYENASDVGDWKQVENPG